MNALQMVNELLSRFSLSEVAAFSGTTGADDTVALLKLNIAMQMIYQSYPFTWTHYETYGYFNAATGTRHYTLSTPISLISRFIVAKHRYNAWRDCRNYRPRDA